MAEDQSSLECAGRRKCAASREGDSTDDMLDVSIQKQFVDWWTRGEEDNLPTSSRKRDEMNRAGLRGERVRGSDKRKQQTSVQRLIARTAAGTCGKACRQ